MPIKDSDVQDDEAGFDAGVIRRWLLPSFLVRNYQFGYERECHDLLFSGENRKGARETEIVIDDVPEFKDQ